jgi:hypothetical protein
VLLQRSQYKTEDSISQSQVTYKIYFKSKVRPRTSHEGLEGEQTYSSTLSLTSALDGGVVNATPRLLYPQKRAPGQVWMGAKNLAPYRIRSPDHPASSELIY